MGKKPKPEAVPPGDRFIRVAITEADQDALRLVAAKHKMSMAALARWLIHDFVAKESEGTK